MKRIDANDILAKMKPFLGHRNFEEIIIEIIKSAPAYDPWVKINGPEDLPPELQPIYVYGDSAFEHHNNF